MMGDAQWGQGLDKTGGDLFALPLLGARLTRFC